MTLPAARYPPLPPELARHRRVSVQTAAQIKNVSIDTFKRHYGHLIEQVSPRRNAVKLAALLDDDCSTTDRRRRSVHSRE